MIYPDGIRTKTYKERILRCYLRKQRNRPVAVIATLHRDEKPFYVRVHHLVLCAFVGPCPKGQEGCHNDGDPTNNRVTNLRWDSHIGNLADMDKHGTRTQPPVYVGEAHPRATITVDQAQYIKSIKAWPHGEITRIARSLGISVNVVSDIKSGLTWKEATNDV
jgi:hypothetical protein